MLKRIENKEDMLTWANEINNGLMTQRNKSDYQDVWGHSTPVALETAFLELNGQRAVVLQSVFNTMSYSEVERLLLILMKTKANKIIEDERAHDLKLLDGRLAELNKRHDAIIDRENRFAEARKPYYKRLNGIKFMLGTAQHKIDRLQRDIDAMREFSRVRGQELAMLREKAEKYDAIKAAIA